MHLPTLGGRRRPNVHSKNTTWKNASFRAYADNMETEEFRKGIEDLLQLSKQRTAIMCAEALWWRCHRSLISDYLRVRGVEIIDILDEKHTEVHPYTSAAASWRGSCLMRVCSLEGLKQLTCIGQRSGMRSVSLRGTDLMCPQVRVEPKLN